MLLLFQFKGCDFISDNGKQINFILEKIQTNDSISTYSEVYHFKPCIDDLKKHVTLKISGGADINSLFSKLGLPGNKGDVVTLEIGVKEIQSKLIQEEPKEEIEE